MKKVKKRVLCLSLSVLLSIGSVSASYASASVIIGGGAVIATEYAFAWLLGAVGLTAASVAVYENADSIKAWGSERIFDFETWAEQNASNYNEWADITSEQINVWCDTLANGVVDKGSSVWSAFKSWASSIYSNSGIIEIPGSLEPVLSSGKYTFANGRTSVFSSVTSPVYCYAFHVPFEGSLYFYCLYFVSSEIFSEGYVSAFPYGSYYFKGSASNSSLESFNMLCSDGRIIVLPDMQEQDFLSILSSSDFVLGDSYSTYESLSYVGGISNIFDRDGSLDNVDLVGVGSVADTMNVPIVWTGEDDLTDALSRVVAGEDSWANVLENAGLIVVDCVNDTVIDDEGETDKPIAGVIPSLPPSVPSELKDYTVDGLSDLFPFCLPFDLVDFFGVLAAEPETPCFTWTFFYPTLDGMKSYDLLIDLSAFDSVAELLRDMECVLFIVGLILITRDQMIKG